MRAKQTLEPEGRMKRKTLLEHELARLRVQVRALEKKQQDDWTELTARIEAFENVNKQLEGEPKQLPTSRFACLEALASQGLYPSED